MRDPLTHDLLQRRLDVGCADRDRGVAAKTIFEAAPVFGQHAVAKQIGADLDDVIAISGFPAHGEPPLIANKPETIRFEQTVQKA